MRLQQSDIRYIFECQNEIKILKRRLRLLTQQNIADQLGVHKSAVQKVMACTRHKKLLEELQNASVQDKAV